MAQEIFQNRFEVWVPEVLQAAFDYCDADPAVEQFWVVAIFDGTVSAQAAYSVRGTIVGAYELGDVLPAIDCGPDAQALLQRDLVLASGEFSDAVTEANEEMPTRIVLRYQVAAESMEASMTYDDLQPGNTADDRLANGPLLSIWVERLRATGNDSADADVTDIEWLAQAQRRRDERFAAQDAAASVSDDDREDLVDEFAAQVVEQLDVFAEGTQAKSAWFMLQQDSDPVVIFSDGAGFIGVNDLDEPGMSAQDFLESIGTLVAMLRRYFAGRGLAEPARLVIRFNFSDGEGGWEIIDELGAAQTPDEWVKTLVNQGE